MLLYLLIGLLVGILITGIIFLGILRKRDQNIREKDQQVTQLTVERDTARNEVEQLRNLRVEQEKSMQETLEKMNREFRLVANDLLEEKSRKLTDLNSDRLKELLNPFREQLTRFEKRVNETHESRLQDHSALKSELKRLQELNQQISEDATNLTHALKGDVKKMGNWGEMVLEKLLERSGLVRGEEYEVQVALQDEEGRRLQPDVVIYLPEEKNILIDSKVSLVAYERFINEDNPEKRAVLLKEHIASLRRHIKDLSMKNYTGAKGIQSPEFVLMFIPIESSFSLAVREDIELFNEAWDKQIVMVSPTTLLATLMTISSIWKQAKQSKHAQLIADQGAKLYEKLRGFLEDFVKIGDRLNSTRQVYDEAQKKIQTGRGNLIKKAEDMKKLGLPTSQKLPESFKDFEDEED